MFCTASWHRLLDLWKGSVSNARLGTKHILWRPKEASGNLLSVQALLEKLLCTVFPGEIAVTAYGRHKARTLGTGMAFREAVSWAFHACHCFLPTCSQQKPRRWAPPCFRAEGGQCESGEKVAKGNVKTGPEDCESWRKPHQGSWGWQQPTECTKFTSFSLAGQVQRRAACLPRNMAWLGPSTKTECPAHSAACPIKLGVSREKCQWAYYQGMLLVENKSLEHFFFLLYVLKSPPQTKLNNTDSVWEPEAAGISGWEQPREENYI